VCGANKETVYGNQENHPWPPRERDLTNSIHIFYLINFQARGTSHKYQDKILGVEVHDFAWVEDAAWVEGALHRRHGRYARWAVLLQQALHFAAAHAVLAAASAARRQRRRDEPGVDLFGGLSIQRERERGGGEGAHVLLRAMESICSTYTVPLSMKDKIVSIFL
jgi:hypothetical protein